MGYYAEALWVCCDHRLLTRIAAMKHLDHGGVPVLYKTMVAVNLQLVSLVIVMALDHLPCVEDVFRVLMPDILHHESR